MAHTHDAVDGYRVDMGEEDLTKTEQFEEKEDRREFLEGEDTASDETPDAEWPDVESAIDSELRKPEDPEEEEEEHESENLGVLLTAFLLITDMVGNGVLSIPNSFATLGWIPAHITLFVCFCLSLAAGLLLWRLRSNKYHTARSYPQMFGLAFDKKGRIFSAFNTYPLLFLYTSAFSYTQGSAWASLFEGSSISANTWMVIAGGCSLMVLQLRSFKAMAVTSILAIVTICIPIFISFAVVVDMVKDEVLYPVGQKVLFSTYGVSECVVAAMDILYAFAGAVVFLEIMSSMKLVKMFPMSLFLSQLTAYLLYALVGSVIYGVAGDADWLQSPYINSLVPGTGKIVAQVCIIIHVSVGIVVTGNVLIYGLQRGLEPQVKKLVYGKENAPYSVAKLTEWKIPAMLWWLLWSTLVIILSVLVNIVIPSFQTFLALVASLICSQTTLIWPAALDLYAFCKERQGRQHIFTAVSVGIVILGLVSLVLGLYGDVQDIISLS